MGTTNEVILDLLNGAAAAHGLYEAEVLDGVYDEGWPEWYAAHMTRALADLGYRLVEASDRDDQPVDTTTTIATREEH
jgi:hypothetical protein